MSEIFARKVLFECKKETTYNTWLDPVGQIMWVENLKFTSMQTDTEKDINICGEIGSQPTEHYDARTPIEFDFYFRGVNTLGQLPHENNVFLAGARAVTQSANKVVISTLDEGVDSTSIRIHHDGNRYPASGMRGVITWAANRGKKGMWHFKGVANHRPAESGTFPSVNCEALDNYPAIYMNSSTTCSYFGLTPNMISVSTSYGADARFENNVNAGKEIIVDDRNLTAKVDFRSIAIATGRDWDADIKSHHKDGVTWIFGDTDGKIIEIEWPRCQINSNDPTGTDGGKRSNSHELALLTDSNGHDEIITFR